jgi:hypothetical protein
MLGFRNFLRAVMGMLALLDKKLLLIRCIFSRMGNFSLCIASFDHGGILLHGG